LLPTVAATVLALAASVVLTLAGWGAPVAVAHLAFAVGIVPLIVAAMSHFVPVLTRTGEPSRPIRLLPAVAQGAGLLAVASMAGLVPRSGLHLAATADFLVAATMLTVFLSTFAGDRPRIVQSLVVGVVLSFVCVAIFIWGAKLPLTAWPS